MFVWALRRYQTSAYITEVHACSTGPNDCTSSAATLEYHTADTRSHSYSFKLYKHALYMWV